MNNVSFFERVTMRIRVYRLLEGGGKGKDPQVAKIRAAHAEKKESIFTKSFGTIKLSIRDQTLFAKRLAFLVNAGVTLLESLHVLRDQTHKSGMKRVLSALIRDIAEGQYLSTSMKKMPRTFSGFVVNIIRVGEMSGVLSTNLNYLAEELRKRDALRRKVLTALVYPMFITVATLGVSALLTAYIFPKIMPIFSSLNVELPITTIILIAVSASLRAWGLVMVGVIVGAIFIIGILHKRVLPFRLFLERVMLSIPIVGSMMQAYNVANFTRTLGILLKSGASVNEAMTIVGDTLASSTYRNQCRALAVKVTRGEQISKHLLHEMRLFPPIMAHMVAIGEKTGKLSDTLIYLSTMYEEDVDEQTKNLSSSIEPLLLVFMGFIVGFVAVSVITPIYSITQNLSR